MLTAYPYHIDDDGRTASATQDEYVRQLIEQVLFTTPGERVNRPDFGCGLRQLVFEPAAEELGLATQALVRGGLQQWLGDWIEIEDVNVIVQQESLHIAIQYVVKQTGERHMERFQQGTPG